MRSGKVFIHDQYAGLIKEDEEGYTFTYEETYLHSANAVPVSLTLPLRKESYQSKGMIPFFDGLIPEGWLLDITIKNWKLNARDRMGLLLSVCKDCIGAVSVIPVEEKENV